MYGTSPCLILDPTQPWHQVSDTSATLEVLADDDPDGALVIARGWIWHHRALHAPITTVALITTDN